MNFYAAKESILVKYPRAVYNYIVIQTTRYGESYCITNCLQSISTLFSKFLYTMLQFAVWTPLASISLKLKATIYI